MTLKEVNKIAGAMSEGIAEITTQLSRESYYELELEAIPNSNMTRKFTGKTDNFEDNQERHFFQRMLRAYLKGNQYFYFGFKWIGSSRVRQQWKVMQEVVS